MYTARGKETSVNIFIKSLSPYAVARGIFFVLILQIALNNSLNLNFLTVFFKNIET